MNIVVAGLWHLGCVTAACCARHFNVTGLDFEEQVVADLSQGRAPLLEPGLDELIQAGLASGRLRFVTKPAAVILRSRRFILMLNIWGCSQSHCL